jgi:hypothetical protein
MELTQGIIKSVDSAVAVVMSTDKLYAIKYRGVIFIQNSTNVRLFATQGAAKASLTKFVEQLFRQGEYWQSCSKNIKRNTGFDVDFSATIALLPSSGYTSRFEDSENKKMFKDIATALLKEKIFTIEEV